MELNIKQNSKSCIFLVISVAKNLNFLKKIKILAKNLNNFLPSLFLIVSIRYIYEDTSIFSESFSEYLDIDEFVCNTAHLDRAYMGHRVGDIAHYLNHVVRNTCRFVGDIRLIYMSGSKEFFIT